MARATQAERSVPIDGTANTSIRAVERAVELLFCLGGRDGSRSLEHLAREIGCSKSTVHRLLGTLEGLGAVAVERDGHYRRYRLGPRIRELGREGWAQIDLRQIAQPHLSALRDESEETVTLHLVEGDAHVVVEQVESPQEIRRILPMGQRTPLLRGATAKAILAFMPGERVRTILAATRVDDYEGPTDQELADIRSLGYSFSLAERIPGGSSISAPVLDRSGQVTAALSISGPSFRFTPARALRCAPGLLAVAERISASLGYVPPPGSTRKISTSGPA
jgi:DNA-binding IclR family transcriptional regulator